MSNKLSKEERFSVVVIVIVIVALVVILSLLGFVEHAEFI